MTRYAHDDDRLPWFKFFPDKWLGGIACLSSPTEIAVYLLVCVRQYQTGAPVTDSAAQLARRCQTKTTRVAAALDQLIAYGKLIRDPSGALHNPFADKLIAERQASTAKRSLAGNSARKARQKGEQNQTAKEAITPRLKTQDSRKKESTTAAGGLRFSSEENDQGPGRPWDLESDDGLLVIRAATLTRWQARYPNINVRNIARLGMRKHADWRNPKRRLVEVESWIMNSDQRSQERRSRDDKRDQREEERIAAAPRYRHPRGLMP